MRGFVILEIHFSPVTWFSVFRKLVLGYNRPLNQWINDYGEKGWSYEQADTYWEHTHRKSFDAWVNQQDKEERERKANEKLLFFLYYFYTIEDVAMVYTPVPALSGGKLAVRSFQMRLTVTMQQTKEVATVATKTSTSLGAGRTGTKQWLQNAGNLKRGQLIKDIEGAGFKRVSPLESPSIHYQRGGTKIRLDAPDKYTPFNHMHLNYGGNKNAYDIFLNPVNYKSPTAHIPIR